MLFRVIKSLIDHGKTDGLREKIDVFFAVGSISEDEYNTLIGLLGG